MSRAICSTKMNTDTRLLVLPVLILVSIGELSVLAKRAISVRRRLLTTPSKRPIRSCYCSTGMCQNRDTCSGYMCIIGRTNATNKIVKTCIDGIRNVSVTSPSCYNDLQFANWRLLCFCDTNFCNNRNDFHQPKYVRNRLKSKSALHSKQYGYGGLNSVSTRIFDKLGGADASWAGIRFSGSSGDDIFSQNVLHDRTTMPILLIVIPLVVGGVAVAIVVINYYCKMC